MGSQITTRPAQGIGDETLQHLLLDQVAPRALAQMGRVVLHAGAVQTKDAVIAFAGDTGSGKSTLTASFHAAGFRLLSDDGLVIRLEANAIHAIPTYPSLRLWPDSLAGLYTRAPALAPMAHYSLKQRVMVMGEAEVSNIPRKVGALFVLSKQQDSPSTAVVLTQLAPADACMAIIQNCFQLDATDRGRATSLFFAASNIAQHLPVFSVDFPRDYSRLPEVREAILRVSNSFAVGSL